MVYMISYDLNAPSSNREAVEESIKSLGTWCKYLTTTFLVKSDLSHKQVNQIALSNLDSNDKIIVCKVEKPIFGKLTQKQWDWINTNL